MAYLLAYQTSLSLEVVGVQGSESKQGGENNLGLNMVQKIDIIWGYNNQGGYSINGLV